MVALLDVDLYKSSLLKRPPWPGAEEGKYKAAFEAYNKAVDDTADDLKGEVWSRSGDGAILLFPSVERAIEAALLLLDGMRDLNRNAQSSLSGAVLLTRIGIHTGEKSLSQIDDGNRGNTHHPDLDTVGKLQKACPVGRIAISSAVYNMLGMRRPLFRLSPLKPEGLTTYVLAERSCSPQEEVLFEGLEESQKRVMPPVPFFTWQRVAPAENVSLRSISKLLEEPFIVILGESVSKHRGALMPAATSDAVGIIEAVAALKSNHGVRAAIDMWADTADLVSNHHIVLVGSGLVNAYSFALNDVMANLKFAKQKGKVFNQIIAKSNGKENEKVISFATQRTGDAGFVAISKNPFDPYRSLTWVAGVSGMATQAAALLFKDLVVDPGDCLHKLRIDKNASPIGCVVAPTASGMEDDPNVSDYYQKWRIMRYRLLWAVDHEGSRIGGQVED